MPTITLKNVPDELHRRLKERAERHHRSLNREAIRCLEAAVAGDEPEERSELLKRLDAVERLSFGVQLCSGPKRSALNAAICSGPKHSGRTSTPAASKD